MSPLVTALLFGLMLQITAVRSACDYGPSYIDQCTNVCRCLEDEGYACSRVQCLNGGTATTPMTCSGADDLPKLSGVRVMCHEGIVKIQQLDEDCLHDAVFWDKGYCNKCKCSNGRSQCTKKACIPPPQPRN